MNKYVKIAIIILAPLALAFGVWRLFSGGSGVDLPNRIQLADLETGELISMARSQIKSLPMKNSRNGFRTIYPVAKDSQNRWVVEDRFREGISELAKTNPLKVDTQTFVITED